MGKKIGSSSASSTTSSPSSSSSSWITLVKRAFRSPTKDSADKRNSRRRLETPQEDEEKKREKRRWLFRKSSSSHAAEAKPKAAETRVVVTADVPVVVNEQRHAIAVAAATAAAAEAAVATAQAAMEIARLTRPAPTFAKESWAAVVIQTSFRGYLARRALRALKGLVKLQALVRGHNVRKQAKLTLQCMQALVRVQDRMRDQRARLSHEGSRKSMFAESNNLWESSYLQDIRDRKFARNTSCAADFWDEQAISEMVDIEAMLQSRKDVVLQREKALSQAFSQQMWRTQRNQSLGEEEFEEEKVKWLDRWMATKQWESDGRASTDRKDNIKTVEVDTSRPYSYSVPRSGRRSASYHNRPATPQSVASPLHRAHQSTPLHHHHHSPATPSPAKARPIQVRSASPRIYRDLERCYSAANTPSLAAASSYWLNSAGHRSSIGGTGTGMAQMASSIPNYMAATESAKARSRSQSAPRQRPSTPERDRAGNGGSSAARKRLSYPIPENQAGPYGVSGSSSFSQNLRSPSFKSAHCGFYGMEQRSNLSCYTESIGGEISPCSTTDLRWFR